MPCAVPSTRILRPARGRCGNRRALAAYRGPRPERRGIESAVRGRRHVNRRRRAGATHHFRRLASPRTSRRCAASQMHSMTHGSKAASGATRQRSPRSPRPAVGSLDWRSRPSSGPWIVPVQVDCRLRDERPLRAYAPLARQLRAAAGTSPGGARSRPTSTRSGARRRAGLRHERRATRGARRTDRRPAPGVRDRRQRSTSLPACPTSRSTAERRRPSSATRSSSASSPSISLTGGTRPRPESAATTPLPVSGSGASTPFRSRASSGTRLGRTDPGSTPAPATSGRWPAPTRNLGYAYLPTATPTHNWYGGHRPGDNLFAETLLYLECETGPAWRYTRMLWIGA